MTIHQLKEPCWVLRPNPWQDDRGGNPHYESRDEALQTLAEVREDRDDDPDAIAHLAKVEPVQEPAACWAAGCAGPDCGEDLINEDEGWIIHASSLPELYQSLDAYDWRLCPGEAYCPDCAPECSQVPPLSPAELEAAGQLRLPGVA